MRKRLLLIVLTTFLITSIAAAVVAYPWFYTSIPIFGIAFWQRLRKDFREGYKS